MAARQFKNTMNLIETLISSSVPLHSTPFIVDTVGTSSQRESVIAGVYSVKHLKFIFAWDLADVRIIRLSIILLGCPQGES